MDKLRGLVKSPRFRQCALRGLAGAGFLIVAACVLEWFLGFRQFGNDWWAAWDFVFGSPLVFFYSVVLMLVLLGFLTGVFQRPILATGVLAAVIYGLTYAHINKYAARGEPLLPSDFSMAEEGAQFVSGESIFGMVVVILAILAVTLVVNYLVRRKFYRYDRRLPRWRRWALVPRAVLILAMGTILVLAATGLKNETGKQRLDVEWLETSFNILSPTKTYRENGFLLGFWYFLVNDEGEVVLTYDEDAVMALREKYATEKEEDAAERTAMTQADYNIVVVLAESFYDPERVRGYYDYSGGDVTPVLHEVQKNYPSGWMYSPFYGGGTGNVEFEVLTGLTNYWLDSTPYTDYVVKLDSVPTIASFAKENGYATKAMHSYNGMIYDRDHAMEKLGFDEFRKDEKMRFNEKDAEEAYYLNDRSAYREVLATLEEEDERQMILLTTMQNHLPYDSGAYLDGEFKVESVEDEEQRERMESYLQSVHLSDQYLGEFLAGLDESDEKTAVLWFGDHSGGAFGELAAVEDQEVVDNLHLTPYFIYTNFELGAEVGEDEEAAEDEGGEAAVLDLPTTSPNCLTNTFYDVLGLEKPELAYLTAEACEAEPILAKAHYQYAGEAPKAEGALGAYRLVTYDILAGERYWLGEIDGMREELREAEKIQLAPEPREA